jgi:hypothetical protein
MNIVNAREEFGWLLGALSERHPIDLIEAKTKELRALLDDVGTHQYFYNGPALADLFKREPNGIVNDWLIIEITCAERDSLWLDPVFQRTNLSLPETLNNITLPNGRVVAMKPDGTGDSQGFAGTIAGRALFLTDGVRRS